MITRVGDSAQSARISGIIQQTQARVRDAQIQVSTGKTASSYASLPDKTGLLLRTQQERALTDDWLQQGAQISDRLQAMEGAMGDISDIAERMRSLLVNRLDDSTGTSVPLVEEADTALGGIADALNLRVDGRYLFGGSRTDVQPVVLPDPPPTSADPSLYYQGDNVVLTARVGAGAELSYGRTAADGSFAQLISAVGEARAAHLSGDKAGLQSALDNLTQAIDGIAQLRGASGAKASHLDSVLENHRSTQLYLDEIVSRIQDTDVPSALTALSADQTNLEASYLTVGRLGALSLASYLR